MEQVKSITVKSVKDTDMEVFFEDSKLMIKTKKGSFEIKSCNKNSGEIGIAVQDNIVTLEVKTKKSMVSAMLNTVRKNRELFVFPELETWMASSPEGFGDLFEIVESSDDRIVAGYKYI